MLGAAARDRLQRRRTARRLSRGRDPAAAAIAQALGYRADPDDRAWFDRIETERTRLERSTAVLRTPLRDYSGDPAHDHVLEDRLGELCRRASKPPDAAAFLFALVRTLRPQRCLELGTALGISASYLAAAVRLNGGGSIVTVEASRARADVARHVLSRLELDDVVESRLGRFQEVVPELVGGTRFGFAFVDGHHEEQATLHYFDLVEPALERPRVVVFDDIAWSEGMRRAWRSLRADARVAVAAEAYGMGICVDRDPAAAAPR